jgi:hypothetical protein
MNRIDELVVPDGIQEGCADKKPVMESASKLRTVTVVSLTGSSQT